MAQPFLAVGSFTSSWLLLSYYEDARQLFERSLPPDVALYNEFHALIVHTGKHFCRPRQPRCGECPLKSLLRDHVPAATSGPVLERTAVAP